MDKLAALKPGNDGRYMAYLQLINEIDKVYLPKKARGTQEANFEKRKNIYLTLHPEVKLFLQKQ